MFKVLSRLWRVSRPALALTTVAASILLADISGARADTPEYWERETFRTERSTFSASLSSEEPRTERRRASTRSVPSPRREASDRDSSSSSRRASRDKPVRTASLGRSDATPARPQRSISGGGGVRWAASSGCLDGSLRGVIAQVAAQFGSVTVNSTCRSKSHNARVGGASRSMHLTGDAADFRVHGNWGAASSFIRGLVGGFKHYGGGLFHIDTGPKRSW